MKDAKKIAKELVKKFKELERNGELAREGEKVASAINNLRKERKGVRKKQSDFIGPGPW